MSTKRKNRQDDYDDEDESNLYKPRKGKHTKHAHNLKGKGMRVINSYAEEDFDEDEFFDEGYQSKNNTTRFYISTTR